MFKEGKADENLVSPERLGKDSREDQLGREDDLTSREVPEGVDRRTFLMRSAVVGATAVMTGRNVSAQERTARSIAVPPHSAKTGPPPPRMNATASSISAAAATGSEPSPDRTRRLPNDARLAAMSPPGVWRAAGTEIP